MQEYPITLYKYELFSVIIKLEFDRIICKKSALDCFVWQTNEYCIEILCILVIASSYFVCQWVKWVHWNILFDKLVSRECIDLFCKLGR